MSTFPRLGPRLCQTHLKTSCVFILENQRKSASKRGHAKHDFPNRNQDISSSLKLYSNKIKVPQQFTVHCFVTLLSIVLACLYGDKHLHHFKESFVGFPNSNNSHAPRSYLTQFSRTGDHEVHKKGSSSPSRNKT